MTKVFFVLFVILLGLEFAAPRVLRAVMYHMGWVPRLKYKREQRKRQQNPNTFDEWYIDMMRDLGGIR